MKKLIVSTGLVLCSTGVLAQTSWQLDLRSATGPVVTTQLSAVAGKSRLLMITFELARKCDPMFVYVELAGSKYGTASRQERLSNTRIGGRVNGISYTGPAVKTTYSNGFEAGFAMPDQMALVIAFESVKSLAFVTPDGQTIALPTQGLRPAVDKAIESCTNKVPG